MLPFVYSSSLTATTFQTNRFWQNWDDPGVADVIDSYWNNTPSESKHRDLLVYLVSKYITNKDHLLEVGSGTGLVYEKLRRLIDDQHYTGVDVSRNMLEIAKERFPSANFLQADVFHLPFSENSFEVVTAFEVFGHLNEIQTPIREMFRVASRLVIFTVWSSSETITAQEKILNSVFIHRSFAHNDVMDTISKSGIENFSIESIPLRNDLTAYIIKKNQK
jgi:ubiquinone/menaquinone biosynthesis C-methylase UbiE